ncbi:class I SAM-dependent methyltransferase [Microcoleus sp. FACHB-672]|uniref:class I SAM-dependent methyltransferase n=1 Tax=Microcoleus sp. FACHB-672 TaxID=2692825 RepID=UPI0016854656|nr:class I SAM-dependent methyltransferase [Microcoleus sp. FACHB-672]MBD2042759.1 class I SAM-dependent methyltransferase [Microcoleus sp. FACHB-672]
MDESNRQLCEIIGQQIAESPNKRITFAEYMDLVLYHRQHGYYATNQVNIGTKGDFFTSPHLGADFGELLAEQFFEMWEILGKPAPFQLVEMGAGQGLLAADVLKYLHKHYFDFFEVLEYVIVEKAAALIEEQKHILSKLLRFGANLRWCRWEEMPAESITGCFFSNELVDALPVHQFLIKDGQLKEIYITNNSISPALFKEETGELSTPEIAKYFEFVGIDLLGGSYEDGYRSEVNLAALEWMQTVANRLQRGYVLTIDYGYLAERYYSRQRREGTLQCYYQHAHHNDPYINVGRQDITAHVDFTALQRQGALCRLQPVGFAQQGLFLMALGLGDRIAALSNMQTQDISDLLRRREALHQLMNPMGLGNFGVLIQSKGLNEEEKGRSLKGLSVPVM